LLVEESSSGVADARVLVVSALEEASAFAAITLCKVAARHAAVFSE
jgi:hypothetical protein